MLRPPIASRAGCGWGAARRCTLSRPRATRAYRTSVQTFGLRLRRVPRARFHT
ncbi:hypothetical protein GBP346_B1011 [Burkholderia pseudomallei MSHR346]|nr:hypothetical protein GBP346_B1011 [Burkholderia pseudomallei MSHR346]